MRPVHNAKIKQTYIFEIFTKNVKININKADLKSNTII